MSDIAIKVEGLSKQYRIGAQGARYQTLRKSLVNTAQAPFRKLQSVLNGAPLISQPETIWALDNVTFEIKHGEAVGVIGRNGAGKSTLLKILSRITRPTRGRVELFGRVGSLLEVGTGFHPELTGRENISLYGAILGMSRREIERKFDEIVDFAEIERFLDTPVKHYSSGMYVRLAFAVAAHLEPEILLVDEVLAVGDAQFQKKCLGKMGDVANEGRTVLFVSHNMAAIQNIAKQGIFIESGKIAYRGDIGKAIDKYLGILQQSTVVDLINRTDRRGTQSLKFSRVWVTDQHNQPLNTILTGQDIKIFFEYQSDNSYAETTAILAFNIYNSQGVLLTNLNTRDVNQTRHTIGRTGQFVCNWPRFNLRSGIYSCALFCELNGIIVDWLQSAFQLVVEDGDYFLTGSLIDRSQGEFLTDYHWSSIPN